jgi:transposase
MTVVVIGIDPHKASHTAVAVDEHERGLGQVRVRASAGQAERLLGWAERWPQRSWAVENASGLGYLLAQQLVGAGERVVDVQPKLAARVRLLASAGSGKSDPHDAHSVAIVALRSSKLPRVRVEDHVAVMKVWIRRRRHLSRMRTRLANQLHVLLGELIPGGFAKELTARQATALLESLPASTAVDTARVQLAGEILEDLRRVDEQLREVHKRLTALVLASKTSLTGVFGVGPVIAAMVLGITGEVTRFPDADHFAGYAGTAPVEVSSGPHKVFRLSRRGNRQLNHAIHMAAVTQIRHVHSDGYAYYKRKIGEGKSPKMALRALKRRITTTLYEVMIHDVQHRAHPPSPITATTAAVPPDSCRTAPPAARVKTPHRVSRQAAAS